MTRLIAPRRAVIRGGHIVARTEPPRHTIIWAGHEESVDFLRRESTWPEAYAQKGELSERGWTRRVNVAEFRRRSEDRQLD